MSKLWLDTETYSPEPIKSGTHRYAEQVEVMIVTYAIDDGQVQTWDVTSGAPMPSDLQQALADPDVIIICHNSFFDRTVTNYDKRFRIAGDEKRWFCTMTKAMAHGLPGSLGALCEIFNIPTDKAKDKRGHALILLFCKPNKDGSRNTRLTHPVQWAEFLEYAANDISAMRAIDKKLPTWNWQQDEIDLWHLDQRINDRGFLVDVELAKGALRAVDKQQAALASRTEVLTDGEVDSATRRDALLKHLLSIYGVDLPDMQASTLERRLNDENLPAPVRELLAIRLESALVAVKKYKTLLRCMSTYDNRLRGTLQFDGAKRTRRWAGRIFQPQNIARPTHKQIDIDTAVELFKYDGVELCYDNVIALASSCLRASIIASPGKHLAVADLANIESRVIAYLAGEEWKLQAFRDYDAGVGPDIYKRAYSSAFKVPIDSVTKHQRQIGKVQELMLMYGGGVGAWIVGAATYGINLDELAEVAYDTLPPDLRSEAIKAYDWAKKEKRLYGLSQKTWVTCDTLKRAFRRDNPKIQQFWFDLENAMRSAIANPSLVILVGKHLTVDKKGAWLRIRLPSGHYLCYPGAKINEKGQICYMGENTYSRKWQLLSTYGGKAAENATSGLSRDIMARGMPLIEQNGFDILLTVHDEIVTETVNGTAEHLVELMTQPAPFCPGLPLAAAGFVAPSYRKD